VNNEEEKMSDIKKIPMSPYFKKIMKPDVVYVWLTCPECGAEWECTEKRKEDLTKLPQGFICIHCFDTKQRNPYGISIGPQKG
jgi:hypothetical protein